MKDSLRLCPNWYILISEREIPKSSYELHTIHCERFLYKCKSCLKAVPKSQMEEHNTSLHKKSICPYCKRHEEERLLGIHKAVCPEKPAPCIYCGALLRKSQLSQHETDCGSTPRIYELMSSNVSNICSSHPEKRKALEILHDKKRLLKLKPDYA
jgi:hypothetical protein